MRENSNHVLAHRVAARLRAMRGSVVSDAWTVAPRDALPTKPKKLLVLLDKHVDVRTTRMRMARDEGRRSGACHRGAAGNMKWTILMIVCGETGDQRRTCGTGPARNRLRASYSPRRLPSGHGCITQLPTRLKRRGHVTSSMSSLNVAVVALACSSRTRGRGLGSPVSRTGRLGPTRPIRNRVRPSRRPR